MALLAACGSSETGPECCDPAPFAEPPFLLVVNKAESTVSFVDPDTGTEVAVLPTGLQPHEVAVSKDGRLAFVTDYGSAARPGNTLTVVDVSSLVVVGTIGLGVHTRPHGVATATDGSVWVTTEGSRHVLQIDPTSGRIERAVETAQAVTHMIALSESSGWAVTANIGSGTATVLSLVDGQVVRHVATGAGAEGVDVHPDGRRAYVSNREADTLVEIDLTTSEVTRSLVVGSFPIRARVRPDGREVLVSNALGNEVVAVDIESWSVVRRLPVGSVPIGILIAPDNRTAYVANTGDDRVTVIDLQAWGVTGQIEAGREPDGMDWVP